MKAWRFESYGKPDSMQFMEIPRPAPQSDEVLVKVVAAGVNRSDIAAVAGAFKSTTPRTPGRDFAKAKISPSKSSRATQHGRYAFVAASSTIIFRPILFHSTMSGLVDLVSAVSA